MASISTWIEFIITKNVSVLLLLVLVCTYGVELMRYELLLEILVKETNCVYCKISITLEHPGVCSFC